MTPNSCTIGYVLFIEPPPPASAVAQKTSTSSPSIRSNAFFDGLRGSYCCVTRQINTGAEEFICWHHFCIKTTPYNHNNKMILASTMAVICPISFHLSNALCEAISSKVKLISTAKKESDKHSIININQTFTYLDKVRLLGQPFPKLSESTPYPM